MVNIIIAEDDNDDFLMLKETLEQLLPKFHLKRFLDGKAFSQSLLVDPEPDLVFLDLNMPKKNGIECLIELRQKKKLDPVPVVIYSTSSDFEDIDKCYKNGCTLYLVKPTSFNQLLTQLRKIFFRIGLPRKELQSKEMFIVQKRDEANDQSGSITAHSSDH